MEVILMSSELSINSVAANPANMNPQVKTDQATATPQANQSAQQSVDKAKTDTITVSEAALQKVSKTATSTITTPQADKKTQPPVEKNKTDKVTVSNAASQMASKAATVATIATLTGSALAHSLKQQGQPLSQIALKMGITLDKAARLLGIQVPEESTESVAAKAQEAQQGKQ